MSETEVPIPPPAAAENYFAPSRPAGLPWAVAYQGEWESAHDGTARAVREYANALSLFVPTQLRSLSGGPNRSVLAGDLDLVVRETTEVVRNTEARMVAPIIRHLVVTDATRLERILVPAVPMGSAEETLRCRQQILDSTVVMSVWERDRIPAKVARLLSGVAENWVPCEQNAKALRDSGVTSPIRVFPHPWMPGTNICEEGSRRSATRHDLARRFYAIGRWEPRKNFHTLIAAFMAAFKPDEAAFLTLKLGGTRWPDYLTPEEAVRAALQRPDVRANGWTGDNAARRISIYDRVMPQAAIDRMHFENNIYVCPSHGEAWCYPAWDAMVAGNRLVYHPWTGVHEFGGRSAPPHGEPVLIEGDEMERVPESYGWGEASWASVTEPRLVDALRAAAPPERFQFLGGRAEEGLVSFDVGLRMSRAVKGLANKLVPAESVRDARPVRGEAIKNGAISLLQGGLPVATLGVGSLWGGARRYEINQKETLHDVTVEVAGGGGIEIVGIEHSHGVVLPFNGKIGLLPAAGNPKTQVAVWVK